MPQEVLTDLDAIERLATKHDNENLEFRAFVKGRLGWSDRRLNQVVRETTDGVWSKIDCTACANCCRVLDVVVTDEDIGRLAKPLNISVPEFEALYVIVDAENDKLLKGKPCPFLKDNRCSVYDHRPQTCRSYPHLYEDFRPRTLQYVDSAHFCPIVFNVLERLKRRIPWRGRGRGW
ncbi:MAG: YkgJ family cysteine cluster protein [Armatimonadetes bacterium]|nr:YkgJ family cysteine cluster protein [Armatimonadota bacterium]